MEARAGEWYLCETYIDEPVLIKAVEPFRIRAHYLISGKTKWLGYPKIWAACKPHPIPFELEYDDRGRAIVLRGADGETRRHALSALRAQFLPEAAARLTSAGAAWSDTEAEEDAGNEEDGEDFYLEAEGS